MKKDRRSKIYDGADIVSNSRISYNLDFWNGHNNCNPINGKHKTVSIIKDGRFAIIWSDDINDKHIGKVVSDEEALIEIVKAKKYKLLYSKRFERLKVLYEKNPKKYDAKVLQGRINKKKLEEIVIITKDGFLVGLYTNNSRLQVKHISDLKEPPRNYYRIWGIEDGIQAHRNLSNISREYRKKNK